MATLKISDLSVGDWVAYKGHPYQVYSIDESGVVNARNGDGTAPLYLETDISDFEPRPITVEVLLDNGFTEIDLTQFGRSPVSRRFEHGYLGIMSFPDGTFSVFDIREISLFDARHLHELQRAVRALGLSDELTL